MKCCVKDHERLGVNRQRGELPNRILYWYEPRIKFPGLSSGRTAAVIRCAFMLAEQYQPIPCSRISDRDKALITIEIGNRSDFDGAGGTLAMAEVASLYELEQRGIWFDPDDSFTTSSAKNMEVYALPVLCHEIGHTFGFGHGKSGLMAPYYNPLVTTPSKAEVIKFFRAYPELRH